MRRDLHTFWNEAQSSDIWDTPSDDPVALKDDAEKPRPSLIDPRVLLLSSRRAIMSMGRWAMDRDPEHLRDALRELGVSPLDMARVLEEGTKKYSDHNWRKGLMWSRMYNAALRHLGSMSDWDDETGLGSDAHAACEIMFLLVSQLDGLGTDDMNEVLGLR